MFENLLVGPNDPKFKTTKHKFKLSFIGCTKCTRAEALNIPLYHFDFVSFGEILSGKDEGLYIGILLYFVSNILF